MYRLQLFIFGLATAFLLLLPEPNHSQTTPISPPPKENTQTLESNSSNSSVKNADPKSRAYIIRKKAWVALRYLRATLLNFDRKAEWDNLLGEYTKGETSFQRAEWENSANQFQTLKSKLDQIAENQSKEVLGKSDILEKEIQPAVVDIKLNPEFENKQYIPVIEKHLQIYRDTWLAAKSEKEAGNQGHALYFAKQGLLQLFKAKILLEKSKEGKLEPEAKLSRNRVLETDYLNPADVKYWDDCLELLHVSEENGRQKEKASIRRVYELRKGTPAPVKEEEASSQSGKK
ncbi:hypothetical protein [Leptospira perolatii]|uniref:hypothetical protein n=1 Tax=Leptospira perolatii TaxID=2023191 RepID=UPI001A9CB254|nr:hypothetical protein [Leptospira perolatii]